MKTTIENPQETIIHSLSEEKQPEDLNAWQKVSEATGTVVTPANALDSIAFGGSMYGIQKLKTWKGIGITATSFGADFVDGKIARATKTESPLGESIDAVGDKIKLAFALYKIREQNLAPNALINAIAAQNGANAILSIIDRTINDKPVIHANWFGKKAIFAQEIGLGIHVIGSKVAETNEKKAKLIKKVGSFTTICGLVLGTVATTSYASTLYLSTKNRKSYY